MTRETKIGLLVGLAFIIVIGILLSDYHRGGQEPPAAVLDRAGATARQAVNVPGANGTIPPITLAPDQITPGGAVQTPRDIEPPASPVVIGPRNSQSANLPGLPANDPLAQAARQQGEELVPVDPNGNATPQTPGTLAENTYRAQPGDSVSRMAARLMGANTAKNRKAIIAANPSLQSDPDKVIAGQDYVIPGRTVSTAAAVTAARAEPAGLGSPGTSAPTNGGLNWTYTVKSGDTLWAIAVHQLGNGSQMQAIEDLNQDVLHGQTTLQPNMKLRLPAPPVAVAN
jgi:nucleoid-associated protein YgaU